MTVAVLFDLEDTLVQTPWADPQHVIEFRTRTREKLIELGIPPGVLKGIERATIMRNKAAEYVEKNFSKASAENFYREIEDSVLRDELDSAQRAKLFPDTIPTLAKLKQQGIRMGLVTNTSARAVSIFFERFGLGKFFDVVVTRDNVKRLKPESEGILVALKKLDANNFFMVGDLVHDALAAKSADGKSIIVKRNSSERLDFEADYVVESLNEVPVIVQMEMRIT